PRPHPLHVPYTTLFRSPPSPIAPGELRLSSSMKVTLVGFDCCVYSGFSTFDSGASKGGGGGPPTKPEARNGQPRPSACMVRASFPAGASLTSAYESPGSSERLMI